jgi:hypothetical protein
LALSLWYLTALCHEQQKISKWEEDEHGCQIQPAFSKSHPILSLSRPTFIKQGDLLAQILKLNLEWTRYTLYSMSSYPILTPSLKKDGIMKTLDPADSSFCLPS